MKRLGFLVFMCIMTISLTACGQRNSDEAAGPADGETAAQSNETLPTPTPVVLATPTPKPPPPTPTPRPSPSPTPEPAVDQSQAAVEAEPEAELNTEMILIPAGEFSLGASEGGPEDGPLQTVNLPAFEVDKFEVTNDAFTLFVDATGYVTDAENTGGQNWRKYAEGRGNHPVVKVTWNDAVAFCEWAGKRLPTEVEWEKAARGEDGRTYPWGNDFDATRANVKETGLRGTTAVGSFPAGASPYGVEDVAGNVWEWTDSWFLPYEGNTVANQYFGERFRVTRGGAWFEEPAQVATYNRNAADPDITANDDLGFRCVRDVQ
jgi:formylglycine-generating enzyme required for sulfatase activity